MTRLTTSAGRSLSAWLVGMLLTASAAPCAVAEPGTHAPFPPNHAKPEGEKLAFLDGQQAKVDGATVHVGRSHAAIDARIIKVLVVHRGGMILPPPAASTTEAIDAWTATVRTGYPGAFRTVVDQWVAMAYYVEAF